MAWKPAGKAFRLGSNEARTITAHPLAELAKLYDLSLHAEATTWNDTGDKSDARRDELREIFGPAGQLSARLGLPIRDDQAYRDRL